MLTREYHLTASYGLRATATPDNVFITLKEQFGIDGQGNTIEDSTQLCLFGKSPGDATGFDGFIFDQDLSVIISGDICYDFSHRHIDKLEMTGSPCVDIGRRIGN